MCSTDKHDTITLVDKLIVNYRFELVEDHHSPGSGRYGLRVVLPEDISAVLPYLNGVFDDTWYDHENQTLICRTSNQGYAFRPCEIRVAMLPDPSKAPDTAGEIVDLVNRVWADRDHIVPSLIKRKLPAVYDIFILLPRTNCKQCGYPTCLAFASDLRNGKAILEQCPLLSQPEHARNREQIAALFSPS